MWIPGALALLLAFPFNTPVAVPGVLGASAEPKSEEGLIEVPAAAKLLGSAVVDEVRAYPEMGGGRRNQLVPKLIDVPGIDRALESELSFADTVAFFDRQFRKRGFHVIARVELPSGTAWTVARPDGTVANAIVRDTQPSTIEITEVAARAPVRPAD